MKLYCSHRFLGSALRVEVRGEDGQPVYVVKDKISFGRCLRVYDPDDNELGEVQAHIIGLQPRMDLYLGKTRVGVIRRKFSPLRPRYDFNCGGWRAEGSFTTWDYTIYNETDQVAAVVSSASQENVIDVRDEENALSALLIVIAMDAEKSTRH